MKAEELRIGNWVKDKRNRFWKVHDVLQDGIDLHYDWCAMMYDEIEPIEITEEILLKCGFEDRNYTFNYEGINVEWQRKNTKTLERKGFHIVVEQFDWLIDLEYVHQLQNFYYILKGEELKIEL